MFFHLLLAPNPNLNTPSLSPNDALSSAFITQTSPSGLFVLINGATGFVDPYVSLSLEHHGDDVLGLDNFNCYYEPANASSTMLTSLSLTLNSMMPPSFACSLASSSSPMKDILKGKHITIFKSPDGGTGMRDFTYINNHIGFLIWGILPLYL